MIIRTIRPDEQDLYNQLASHPLQTWEWGEFRRQMGQEVERLGIYDDNGQLTSVCQILFSKLPVGNYQVGYIPRGVMPTSELIAALGDLAKKNNTIFFKLEPNVFVPAEEVDQQQQLEQEMLDLDLKSGKEIFTPYTFQLDLSADTDEIFQNCKSKTRYNIRLARRKGVKIYEDTSDQGLTDYIKLLQETTTRQQFYAHNEKYYQTMFKQFAGSQKLKILKAVYEEKILAVWILFIHNQVAYYPYGASSREHREVMASNLMMWEAIMLAKKQGCVKFDMWGALGPKPDPKHRWYGFHRFKEGYGAKLMQSAGSYDYVTNYPLYSLFNLANSLRWVWLRFRAKLIRA